MHQAEPDGLGDLGLRTLSSQVMRIANSSAIGARQIQVILSGRGIALCIDMVELHKSHASSASVESPQRFPFGFPSV